MTTNAAQPDHHLHKHLLIIGHAPSANTQRIIESLKASATLVGEQTPSSDSSETTLTVSYKEALQGNHDDVLAADAIILFTTENLGYISGGLKDFFDRVYYPCLELTQGLPVCAIIRAGHDGTGSQRALETITTGLRWRWVQAPLILKGPWQDSFLEESHALGEAMAVALLEGII